MTPDEAQAIASETFPYETSRRITIRITCEQITKRTFTRDVVLSTLVMHDRSELKLLAEKIASQAKDEDFVKASPWKKGEATWEVIDERPDTFDASLF